MLQYLNWKLHQVMIKAQPIPIELMMGYKYGTVNLSFSKNFSQNSRLGFFHMNTVQFDYKDEDKNSFILQDLIYVETFKNLRVAGGVAYSKGGFNPTAGQHGTDNQVQQNLPLK
jgi:hypothetical protein